MTSGFSFHTRWELAAPVEAVQPVLSDLEHYPEWWPEIVAVAKIDDLNARVLCRSRLPYTLDLVLTLVRDEPLLLECRIAGDLVGSVAWRLDDVGGVTRLDYTQEVVLTRGLLRRFARPLRPLMEWNHARMMAGCVAGLRERLEVR